LLSQAFYDAFMFVIVDNIMSLFVDLHKPADIVLVDIHISLLIHAKDSTVCVACCGGQFVFIVSTLRWVFF